MALRTLLSKPFKEINLRESLKVMSTSTNIFLRLFNSWLLIETETSIFSSTSKLLWSFFTSASPNATSSPIRCIVIIRESKFTTASCLPILPSCILMASSYAES
eukprot:Pompholyxophrys_punicea_v1_NODE_824_length_1239_cov_8.625000.p2 type:complete len:104 gc:universal NODE_824_length_1239_cov_8.625000:776-465(-)